MQAMVCQHQAPIASAPLVAAERPPPEPPPRHLRVRVRACAICRTDLHVIEGDLPPRRLPIVPGHQVVGQVDALGEGAGRYQLGDRVGIAWLRHTCGVCAFCRRGQENLCPNSRYTGWTDDGGYAEQAVVHEDFAYALPPAFGDAEASALLCAGIIGYRALRRAELPRGGALGIFGFGSSAHLVAQIALGRGARVYVSTRNEAHQRLARTLGVHWAGGAYDPPPVPLDGAIIFAPAGELVPVALAALGPGGTLALAGIVMSDIPALNYERHLFHEKNARSVTANTRADGRELLAEAAALGIKPHVSLYPLRDANRALQDLKGDRLSGTGVLTL